MITRARLVIAVLLERQRTLTLYGGLLLVACAVMTTVGLFDGRTIDDANVWAKPAKFALSIAVFALTAAWFFGCVRPDRRQARPMRALVAILIASGSFELAYITWQAAHGLASHFNRTTLVYAVMYALMGIGALLLTATAPMLAWEIARRPAAGVAKVYLASVVTGLVSCFVLGAGIGFFLAQGTGHSVGATGGHLPLFGWNRGGGDLRPAHFLGIHAEQVIPFVGAMLVRAPVRWQTVVLGLATLIYFGLTLAILAQALAGRPLLP